MEDTKKTKDIKCGCCEKLYNKEDIIGKCEDCGKMVCKMCFADEDQEEIFCYSCWHGSLGKNEK